MWQRSHRGCRRAGRCRRHVCRHLARTGSCPSVSADVIADCFAISALQIEADENVPSLHNCSDLTMEGKYGSHERIVTDSWYDRSFSVLAQWRIQSLAMIRWRELMKLLSS